MECQHYTPSRWLVRNFDKIYVCGKIVPNLQSKYTMMETIYYEYLSCDHKSPDLNMVKVSKQAS